MRLRNEPSLSQASEVHGSCPALSLSIILYNQFLGAEKALLMLLSDQLQAFQQAAGLAC